MIINIHGGPESRARPGSSGHTASYLNEGIAVLVRNVRAFSKLHPVRD